jgi:transcriptional regulator with XRE-family HTH domain
MRADSTTPRRTRTFARTEVPAQPAAEPKTGKRPHDALGRAVNQHVARQIKLLRLVNGLNQTELGRVLGGMTFQQIAKYERGFSRVTPDKLWRIADHFGVEITYFFESFDRSAHAGSTVPATSHRRLRLQLAASLQDIGSASKLRSLLDLMRAMMD